MGSGLLDDYVDGTDLAVNCIHVSLMAMALMIQTTTAYVAWCAMQNNARIHFRLKSYFFLSIMLGALSTIGGITANVLEILGYPYPWDIVPFIHFSNGLFYFFLLSTLVDRLYLTFESTYFAMSTNVHSVFIGNLVLMLMTAVANCTIAVIDDKYINSLPRLTLGILYFALFFFGSMAAVFLFVHNLSHLTTMRKLSSVINHNTPDSAESVSLNDQQMELIQLSARYLLLFAVASFTSLFATFLWIAVLQNIAGVFMAFDFCVNSICLYLQFSFSRHHYLRCCKCLDKRCTRYLSRKAKRSIHKRSIDMSHTTDLASCSSADSDVQTPSADIQTPSAV